MTALGVTRVSFGVQDFDEAVQRAINRVQSFETTVTTVERVVSIQSLRIRLSSTRML